MGLYDICWLKTVKGVESYYLEPKDLITQTLDEEAKFFFGAAPAKREDARLVFELNTNCRETTGSFAIKRESEKIYIRSSNPEGLLYGFYELLRRLSCGSAPDTESSPANRIRMLNHWDNLDGTVERGYAGNSIFFEDGAFRAADERINDYARLLASVGINAVAINNVNVRKKEAGLLTKPLLDGVKNTASVFARFGIKLFLSINFASPTILSDLSGADPLNNDVRQWWKDAVNEIFAEIPNFGGFLIKADSEGEPGPFAYGRDHADGANCIAEALAPHNALLIWRCFVYNCHQDWRDRKTDRARAAYDTFKPLDGKFLDNVALQIKNGPVDFQIREPASPLFGALPNTNALLEFQITQEYTGQQKHICYLVPMWKEILDFNTYAPEYNTKSAPLSEIVGGKERNGITGVANIGMDFNWTGHKLAQANLYGFGRLCWNPALSSEEILTQWIRQTFDLDEKDEKILFDIMLDTRKIYEQYTAPLGVGWMVRPSHHYGPDVDGYEYDRWGTYHFADRNGIGVDRTTEGSGYAKTYFEPNVSMYGVSKTCPDELLLFFHHVPYTYVLQSGKTVIQHIYDTHFEGCERVAAMLAEWKKLEGKISDKDYVNVLSRLEEQRQSAIEWRDQINTYFFRKSGVTDEKGREIYI